MVKHLIAAAPAAIPFLMRSRRRTPVGAYILGGLGVAVVGGIAAVMMLSPKTRNRALLVAKDTVGKVEDKVGHIGLGKHRSARIDESVPVSNGLAADYGTSTEI